MARLKPEYEGERIVGYTLREKLGSGGFRAAPSAPRITTTRPPGSSPCAAALLPRPLARPAHRPRQHEGRMRLPLRERFCGRLGAGITVLLTSVADELEWPGEQTLAAESKEKAEINKT